jgi:hypothetical protein
VADVPGINSTYPEELEEEDEVVRVLPIEMLKELEASTALPGSSLSSSSQYLSLNFGLSLLLNSSSSSGPSGS